MLAILWKTEQMLKLITVMLIWQHKRSIQRYFITWCSKEMFCLKKSSWILFILSFRKVKKCISILDSKVSDKSISIMRKLANLLEMIRSNSIKNNKRMTSSIMYLVFSEKMWKHSLLSRIALHWREILLIKERKYFSGWWKFTLRLLRVQWVTFDDLRSILYVHNNSIL